MFVSRDLTEKGVKKLQNSVDLSYSTIQSLVAKPLQMAAVNMFYFLNTIKGLARISHYFDVSFTSKCSGSIHIQIRICILLYMINLLSLNSH